MEVDKSNAVMAQCVNTTPVFELKSSLNWLQQTIKGIYVFAVEN